MKKIWFRRKTYGYGWTPNTKEGWFVIALFVLVNLFNFIRLTAVSEFPGDVLIPYMRELGISVLVLLGITIRYGETPKWQWGKRVRAKKVSPR